MSVKSLLSDSSVFKASLKPDKVILTLAVAWLALSLISPAQGRASVSFVLDSVIYIAPYFILAVAMAASIKASGLDKIVAQVFSGHPLKAIVIASVFGALSPFCSCGVIPLIASLLAAGVPLAPVMSFWIASPVMDPEMFILTSAGISFDFALAKAGFAIALGLFAGITVIVLQRAGLFGEVLRQSINSGCGTSCSTGEPVGIEYTFWNNDLRRQLFKTEFVQTSWFLGKWLLLAFFIESLMVAYIDPQWVHRYIGGDSILAVPMAAIIGMPSYLNGYAAIPMVGGLMDLGMSQGAAMAFMLTGAVSSIPAAIAVYALVRKQVFRRLFADRLIRLNSYSATCFTSPVPR